VRIGIMEVWRPRASRGFGVGARVFMSAFVDAFRASAERLRARARELAEMFPLWAFPPALPFNAPA